MGGYFTKECIKNGPEAHENVLNPLFIRKCKLKLQMKYDSIPTQMTTPSIDKDVKPRGILSAGSTQNGTVTLGMFLAFSSPVKHSPPESLATSFLGVFSQEK